MTDQPHQQTFGRLAHHDRHALLASLEQPLAGRQVKLSLGLLPAVALEAMLTEQPSHVAFEQLHALGHLGRMISRQVRGPTDAR